MGNPNDLKSYLFWIFQNAILRPNIWRGFVVFDFGIILAFIYIYLK